MPKGDTRVIGVSGRIVKVMNIFRFAVDKKIEK